MKTSGTNFQKKVWNEIKKIPKGRTTSYKQIAIAIGHPKAARAVQMHAARIQIQLLLPVIE